MEVGASIDNVTRILLKSMVKYGGVFNEKFTSKFIKVTWISCYGWYKWYL